MTEYRRAAVAALMFLAAAGPVSAMNVERSSLMRKESEHAVPMFVDGEEVITITTPAPPSMAEEAVAKGGTPPIGVAAMGRQAAPNAQAAPLPVVAPVEPPAPLAKRDPNVTMEKPPNLMAHAAMQPLAERSQPAAPESVPAPEPVAETTTIAAAQVTTTLAQKVAMPAVTAAPLAAQAPGATAAPVAVRTAAAPTTVAPGAAPTPKQAKAQRMSDAASSIGKMATGFAFFAGFIVLAFCLTGMGNQQEGWRKGKSRAPVAERPEVLRRPLRRNPQGTQSGSGGHSSGGALTDTWTTDDNSTPPAIRNVIPSRGHADARAPAPQVASAAAAAADSEGDARDHSPSIKKGRRRPAGAAAA